MLQTHKIRLQEEGAITLVLRARPGAAKTKMKDVLADGSLKIDLAAVAEDGEANAQLMRFLGEEFGVPVLNISLLTGKKTRLKTVRITTRSEGI